MIDVSSLTCSLQTYKRWHADEKRWVIQQLCAMFGISDHEIDNCLIIRKSLDARHKGALTMLYHVRIALKQGAAYEQQLIDTYNKNQTDAKGTAHSTRGNKKGARKGLHHEKVSYARVTYCEAKPAPQFPASCNLSLTSPIVVVGAGCAGLFAALYLAHAGLKPLLIERGESASARMHSIQDFIAHKKLNANSNIQFGIGGAGTFSDGKLGTGTKSPLHKLILETFVRMGAPEHILWDAKPHIGSDILPRIVTNMVKEIEEFGGEVRFSTLLTRLELKNKQVTGIWLSSTAHDTLRSEEHIATHHVILATGHSARDTYIMLHHMGIYMEKKTFAMGVRIEHLQTAINAAQYGSNPATKILGAADYKIACHLGSGRSAFSFCMCPGGYVVAATSEKHAVVTNGMSLSTRAGTNANAGFLANVFPEDLDSADVLAGLKLQEKCEQKAYTIAGETYQAPAQLVGDFLQHRASTGARSVTPTYPLGVTWTDITLCLPKYITQTLREALPELDKKLHGFNCEDAVLTGVETRSSSPLRLTRSETLESLSTQGLMPCGEGAGYAGGIMSAATDGLRVAQALIQLLTSSTCGN